MLVRAFSGARSRPRLVDDRLQTLGSQGDWSSRLRTLVRLGDMARSASWRNSDVLWLQNSGELVQVRERSSVPQRKKPER